MTSFEKNHNSSCQIKLYNLKSVKNNTWAGMVMTTWKQASSWFASTIYDNPNDGYNWYTFDVDNLVLNTYTNNLKESDIKVKFRDTVNFYQILQTKRNKLYIIYRNPYQRFKSAFYQDFLNRIDNNDFIKELTGTSTVKELFKKISLENNIDESSKEYIRYHKILNSKNSFSLKELNFSIWNEENIKYTKLIIKYILKKHIDSGKYYRNHNRSYNSYILRFLTNYDFDNVLLVDMDSINLSEIFFNYIDESKIEESETKVNSWNEPIKKILDDVVDGYLEREPKDGVMQMDTLSSFIEFMKTELNIYRTLKTHPRNIRQTLAEKPKNIFRGKHTD